MTGFLKWCGGFIVASTMVGAALFAVGSLLEGEALAALAGLAVAGVLGWLVTGR